MTRPARERANNQDALVWALYLLGGADRDVDVEDIYLKCFELAPARLGWRTRPDIPDYKKTAKALQSVEAQELPGLLHRPHALARRLTGAGIQWIDDNREILQRVYSGQAPVEGSLSGAYEKLRTRIRSSAAFESFRDRDSLDLIDLADALECSPGSPSSVWAGRIHELRRAADVLQDEQLQAFATAASRAVTSKGEK